jgi:hypothetical protein
MHVNDETRLIPLSVSSDRIARAAMGGATVGKTMPPPKDHLAVAERAGWIALPFADSLRELP